MTHTYAQLFYHIVWSTKNRCPLIFPSFQDRLYQYIGGIIKNMSADLVAIGGMPDHIHLLMYGKPDILLSDVIRQIKSRSTKWLHSDVPEAQYFCWQEGYGVFSVSFSVVPDVKNYIANQERHHKNMSYEQEYLALLERNKVRYDERFVLG